MAISSIPFQSQGFRPNFQGFGPGQSFAAGAPNQIGAPGDRFGMSPEARGAQGIGARGGAQGLTQALSRDIGQVMQAQSSGDQNRSQQALQQLGNTYQQGQQSGQLQQVPPMVRQTAEQLLGINQNQQGKQAGGGGGCQGGGGSPEAGGAQQAGGQEAAKGDDNSNFKEDLLKKLDQLLGKDKAGETKDGEKNKDAEKGKDGKTHDHKKHGDKAQDKPKTDKPKTHKAPTRSHKPAPKKAAAKK